MNLPMIAAGLAAVSGAAAVAQLDRGLPRRREAGEPEAGGPSMAGGPGSAGALGRGAARLSGASHPSTPHAIAAAVAGCVGWSVGGLVPAVVLAGVAITASVMRVQRAARRRRRLRERAAPAFARALADALRGGASVRSGLGQAADDRAIPAALRTELAALATAVRFGAPLDDALDALARRGGAGLRLTCGTIAMHLEAGGALSGELERLATDGETALRIDEERVAATSQARATVRVVAALPILALLGAEATGGGFVATISGNPLALALLILGFALELAAFAAARVIVGGHR